MEETQNPPGSDQPETITIILQPMKLMGPLHYCDRCSKYVAEGPCTTEEMYSACEK